MPRNAGRSGVRLGFWLLCTVLLLLAARTSAEACSCTGWRNFDHVVRAAPVVVVGRVQFVGPTPPRSMAEPDPTFVDLQVEWRAKGQIQEAIVRAWNASAGSSCGGSFARTPMGTEIVVALTPLRPADTDETSDVYWQAAGFKPPPGAYAISSGCADPLVMLKTPKDRSKYFGKRIR